MRYSRDHVCLAGVERRWKALCVWADFGELPAAKKKEGAGGGAKDEHWDFMKFSKPGLLLCVMRAASISTKVDGEARIQIIRDRKRKYCQDT